jgi:CheY-like chemotaxis protein
MMPNLDGFGLVARLRADESNRRPSVIVLSARAGRRIAHRGLQVGRRTITSSSRSPRVS